MVCRFTLFCKSFYHLHHLVSTLIFLDEVWFGFMVFNATFNNISVISWRSVLLVEETEVTRKPPTCRKSLTNLIT